MEDSDETLELLRRLMEDIHEADPSTLDSIYEHFRMLDEGLSNGETLPEDWDR
jgi:hypothetical protein